MKKVNKVGLFMTLIVSGFSIAILFSPSSLLVGITLISMIILEKLEDNDLKIYL